MNDGTLISRKKISYPLRLSEETFKFQVGNTA